MLRRNKNGTASRFREEPNADSIDAFADAGAFKHRFSAMNRGKRQAKGSNGQVSADNLDP